MRLLLLCWRSAMARCSPLMITQVVMTVWQDDFSWTGTLEKILTAAEAWGAVGLAVASVAWLLLYRRARAAGIELSAQALDERQAHLLWATGTDEGWQDRVREQLASSERAYLLLEPARDELTFRWRPGRHADHTVRASLTFDALAGTVLVDVRGGEGHLGVAGLTGAPAFIAMSQIAVAVGLTGRKDGRYERV